jgi:hypothetical protein
VPARLSSCPHFHREMTDVSNGAFPEKWTCMCGLSLGHLRCYFVPFYVTAHVFSGTLKQCSVRATTGCILPCLAGRIRDAMATVTLTLLNNSRSETEYGHKLSAGPLTVTSLCPTQLRLVLIAMTFNSLAVLH